MKKFRVYLHDSEKETIAVDVEAENKKDAEEKVSGITARTIKRVRKLPEKTKEAEQDQPNYKAIIEQKNESIAKLNKKIESLEWKINNHDLRVEEIKDRAQDEIERQKINRIGELKAYQIHLRIMKGQGTHRRKAFFANEAIQNLEEAIDKIRAEHNPFNTDLPF